MTCIQSLLQVFAFCALPASFLRGVRAQVILILPEDPSCRATPEMVHDGLMAVTDPTCLVENDQPGCNLFELPDCRVCALTLEGVADNVPPCELLEIFTLESEAFGDVPDKNGDCVDCEPLDPPPLHPANPVNSTQLGETADPTESSREEDYVPIVIVLPTDVFIEAESSVWTDSEGSDDEGDDAEDDATVAVRRLRTQM